MMKPKFKVQDILFQKEQGVWLYIDNIRYMNKMQKYLYTLKVLKPTYSDIDNHDWKCYYEDKVEEMCGVVARRETAEALYGKSV